MVDCLIRHFFMTVILITSTPHSKKAKDALHFAKSLLDKKTPFKVFFYGDGAYHANRLIWQTADVPCICREWKELAKAHGLDLPVCVSTALARGISDQDNASRHNLDGDNLHPAFRLVGLSDLALLLDNNTSLVQF